MILLDENEYTNVIPMVWPVDINILFAISVLERKITGKVFVDQKDSPAAVYIRHPYGMALLCGETDAEDFYIQLAAYIRNTDKTRDKNEWLQVYPSSLYSRMETLLGLDLVKVDRDTPYEGSEERKVLEFQRINFTFNQERYLAFKNTLPMHDYKIVPASEAIFNQFEGAVVPKHFWNDTSDFIQNGIGFTLLENDVPVSIAFSSFIIDNRLEIGIETSVSRRGSGLASIVCAELIDYCITNGYEPVWSCSSGNIGSKMLAHKIGFDEAKRIPYYRLPK